MAYIGRIILGKTSISGKRYKDSRRVDHWEATLIRRTYYTITLRNIRYAEMLGILFKLYVFWAVTTKGKLVTCLLLCGRI